MNYNFMSNPIMPGQPVQQQGYGNMPFMASVSQYAPPTFNPQVGIIQDKTTEPATSSYGFTFVSDEPEEIGNSSMIITSPIMTEVAEQKPKKKRTAKKQQDDGIVRAANGAEVVTEQPTIESYNQTSMMLEEAIKEIDVIAVDLKTELDAMKANRAARNRTQAISSLGETIGRLLDSKISAIREINNSISKSNDLDYKREKDLRAIQANTNNDDKAIMDLYNAFIHQGPSMPSNMTAQPIIPGNNIVRSSLVTAGSSAQPGSDPGYDNYLANLTPEQNMMYYEHNPNVQTVVVFDHSNGSKFFDVIDITTGQSIPNVTVPDQRFMDDTYLDLKTMTAKNSNLNITYPIIEINKGVTGEY